MEQRMIHKIGLALLRDGKIMMVRSRGRDAWFFVGGKVESGESDLDCLKREVREELDVELQPDSLKHLHQFAAPAHGKPGVTVEMAFYRGEVIGEPKPSSEIDQLEWFGADIDRSKQTMLTNQVFDWLVAEKIIS